MATDQRTELRKQIKAHHRRTSKYNLPTVEVRRSKQNGMNGNGMNGNGMNGNHSGNDATSSTKQAEKHQRTVFINKPKPGSKLGVTMTQNNTEGPAPVSISLLKPGGIAVESGLQVDDVILQVNGTSVRDPMQCTDLLKASQKLSIVVERERR